MRATVVGLTGGMGSGKSTAAQVWQHLGVPVIDADAIARGLLTPDHACFQPVLLQAVQAQFPEALQHDGTLCRATLRQRLFDDPHAKQWLEQQLHPAVTQALIHFASAHQVPYLVWVVPLLCEVPQVRHHTDCIVVVDLPLPVQIRRLTQRDHVSYARAQHMIQQQMPRTERLAWADHVLHNHGDCTALTMQVHRLHKVFMHHNTKGVLGGKKRPAVNPSVEA